MRRIALWLAIVGSVASCGAPMAPVGIDATFVLQTYNGAPLPQLVPSAVDVLLGFESTWLADTIFLRADGSGIKHAGWRRLELADSSITLLPTFATFKYSVNDAELFVEWVSCGEGCTFSSPTTTMQLSMGSTVLTAAAGAVIYYQLPVADVP